MREAAGCGGLVCGPKDTVARWNVLWRETVRIKHPRETSMCQIIILQRPNRVWNWLTLPTVHCASSQVTQPLKHLNIDLTPSIKPPPPRPLCPTHCSLCSPCLRSGKWRRPQSSAVNHFKQTGTGTCRLQVAPQMAGDRSCGIYLNAWNSSPRRIQSCQTSPGAFQWMDGLWRIVPVAGFSGGGGVSVFK